MLTSDSEVLSPLAIEAAVQIVQLAPGSGVHLVDVSSWDAVLSSGWYPSSILKEGSLTNSETNRVVHRAFDPEVHSTDLLAIAREIHELPDDGGAISPGTIEGILRRYPRDGRGFYSRAQIIAGVRHLKATGALDLDEERLIRRMQMRPIRTQSGVTPVTVLTRPHPCPGRCVFCPNDVRMPKSYLADEPGAQRAAQNHFDPYLQTWNRLAAYQAIGHPVDKVEMIILGGTWSFHPEPYQIGFVKRCFDALNDFGRGIDRREQKRPLIRDFSLLEKEERRSYNDAVSSHLRQHLGPGWSHADEESTWAELELAQELNETAGCRSVGLVVETRPDHLTLEEIYRIRRLGCTKVQMGFQSLSDDILELNQRGHDVATTREAVTRLRAAGFKVHAHWMPNLLGATVESDELDFERIFSDPALRPDELKVYPCSLIETAELMRYYESGEWKPYDHDELLQVLVTALPRVPRYCRVTRVIRDISSDDIVAGNKLTNFRQIAEQEIQRRGGKCEDIRAREIRNEFVEREDLELCEVNFSTSVGRECFLEFVTEQDKLAGFARLSLPDRKADLEELSNCALLREVHVYGVATEIGMRPELRAQHRGLGTQLIEAAADRAREAGFAELAVISAVGTRAWYRRNGFRDGELYQHLSLG